MGVATVGRCLECGRTGPIISFNEPRCLGACRGGREPYDIFFSLIFMLVLIAGFVGAEWCGYYVK